MPYIGACQFHSERCALALPLVMKKTHSKVCYDLVLFNILHHPVQAIFSLVYIFGRNVRQSHIFRNPARKYDKISISLLESVKFYTIQQSHIGLLHYVNAHLALPALTYCSDGDINITL